MKNIALITIFFLSLSQTTWAQVSVPKSGQSRGIPAKTSQNSEGEKTRRSLRGSSLNEKRGDGVIKNTREARVGNQKGHAESGRPGNNGEKNSRQGSSLPNLRDIIKRELELTEKQMGGLRKIHAIWHKAAKEIAGGKKFSDLDEEAKEKLMNAWHKFKAARAEILSEEQLAKLKGIHKKHQEIVGKAREQGGREKGEGGREQGGRKPEQGRPGQKPERKP